MISSRIDDRSVSVTPQEPDDLLALRRVIRIGDSVSASTTRAIRAEREHMRPDRGERVRIKVTIDVEAISLDSVLDRLRIRGTITASNNESVSHGSHHSVVVVPGERITVSKRTWSALDKRLLSRSAQDGGYVLIAVDSRECGIARLTGTHLKVLPNIYSGAGGKQYKATADPQTFYAGIRMAVTACAQAGDRIIVFGPGQEKKRLAAVLAESGKIGEPAVVEGIDSGGEDGVYLFSRSQALHDIMSDSKLAQVLGIVEDVMRLAGSQSSRFAMGFTDVKRAASMGAVESIVFSDKVLADAGEEETVALLNSAESGGARVYAADMTTDIGMRVSGLGGVIALLRYAIN